MDLLLTLLADIRPLSTSDLSDDAIRQSFNAFFDGLVGQSYSERAVVTLFTDFAVVRDRWAKRMEAYTADPGPMINIKDRIIMGPSGPEIYDRIISIWHEIACDQSAESWLLRAGSTKQRVHFKEVAMVEA
jgi:hypothetical protein